MSSEQKIEALFEENLGVGSTVLKGKSNTTVTFSYDPISADVAMQWGALLNELAATDSVKIQSKKPKTKGGRTHHVWLFIGRHPAMVHEFLKRALPKDSGVVSSGGGGMWGFEPKNISQTTGFRFGREEEI